MKEKINYESPEMEIIRFTDSDIITASGDVGILDIVEWDFDM